MAFVDKIKYSGPRYVNHREFWAARRAFLEGTSFVERTGSKTISMQSMICVDRELQLPQQPSGKYGKLEFISSCVALMIRKLTSDRFIVIDIPVDNPLAKVSKPTIPVCYDVNPELAVGEFLRVSNVAFGNSREYADFAFSVLFGEERVFQTNVCVTDRDFEISKYDFVVMLKDQHLMLQFHPSKFGKTGAEHIAMALMIIIEQCQNETIRLRDISFNSSPYEWIADQPTNHPNDLVTEFKRSASRFPKSVALVDGDREMTYAELDAASDEMAAALKESSQVTHGTLSGIMMQKSIQTFVAMLAVLKAGGSFLFIDINLPYARRSFLVKDSGLSLLIIDSTMIFDDVSIDSGVSLYLMDSDPVVRHKYSIDNHGISIDDVAYVIYTSGSTGVPKGVLVQHGGVSNMCLDQIRNFGITNADSLLQFSSLSFDASVYETFIAFMAGARLVLLTDEQKNNSSEFIAILDRHKVTTVVLPPSFLNVLMKAEMRHVKTIITAGEPPIKSDALFYSKFKQYVNAYGPTECSVCVSFHKVSLFDSGPNTMPIGKPVSGLKLMIVNEDQQTVLPGFLGELIVTGIGVARGYLNNPEKTSEKFVYIDGEKFYFTGDLCRYNNGHDIEFAGRKDGQVKFNGLRIETSEVESIIKSFPGIEECSVILHTSGSLKLLAAVARVREGSSITSEEVLTHCSACLPLYMVPSRVLLVPEMPTTFSGKISHTALAEIIDTAVSVEEGGFGPENELQEKLMNIWASVLKRDVKTIDSNFFELGGHSLAGVALISMIYKDLGFKIDLSDLFINPSIRTLSNILSGLTRQLTQMVVPVSEGYNDYPLSHAQRSVWLKDRISGDQEMFVIQGDVRIREGIEIQALKRAFIFLTDRHEILRTYFPIVDNTPRQRIGPQGWLEAEVYDFNTKDDTLQSLVTRHRKRFNIEEGPLAQLMIVVDQQGSSTLIFRVHHLLADGWSMKILQRELIALYNAEIEKGPVLAPVQYQFKDFALWQHSAEFIDRITHQKDFWQNEFKYGFEKVALSKDFPAKANERSARTLRSSISKDLYIRKRPPLGLLDATPFVFFFGSLVLLLNKYVRLRDIIIGVPSHGRHHPAFDHLVGMFTNMVPFKITVDDVPLRTFFEGVKTRVEEILRNDLMPFDMLLEMFPAESANGRNPFFDVVFFYEKSSNSITHKNVNSSETESTFDDEVSNYDLLMIVDEHDDCFNIDLTYNSALYNQQSMQGLLNSYNHLVTSILEFSDATTGDLNLPGTTMMQNIIETDQKDFAF